MLKTISVTATDIKKGIKKEGQNRPYCCGIAHSLQRIYKTEDAAWGFETGHADQKRLVVSKSDHYTVLDFIRAHDAGFEVKPFKFNIEEN